MKTSKILKVIVGKGSLSSRYGMSWLNDQFGDLVLDRRVYSDFIVFDLSNSVKSRHLLARLIISISLDIDLYDDVVAMAALIRDIASSLSK